MRDHPGTMPRRDYTDAEKAEALERYRVDGPKAAAAALGISASTITGWAKAAGVRTERLENAQARVEARRTDLHARRLALAADLLDDIARFRGQLFAPCVERKAMNVSDGPIGSHVEIVDIDRPKPTFAEQTKIMTSIGIAVDKAQLLAGEATSRTEVTGTGASIDDEVARLEAELALTPSASAAG